MLRCPKKDYLCPTFIHHWNWIYFNSKARPFWHQNENKIVGMQPEQIFKRFEATPASHSDQMTHFGNHNTSNNNEKTPIY